MAQKLFLECGRTNAVGANGRIIASGRPQTIFVETSRRRGSPGRCCAFSAISAGGGEGNDSFLMDMMEAVREGRLTPCEAASEIGTQFSPNAEALDVESLKSEAVSFPEVVCGSGKSPHEVAKCMLEVGKDQGEVVATRISPKTYADVRKLLPGVEYHGGGHILKLRAGANGKQPRLPGSIAIVTSEAAHSAVVEECNLVANHMGCYSYKVPGVKSSNLHDLISNLSALRSASVLIVVSGTDGALPSVVAGLVDAPVISVPTSAGFATTFGGASAMLSSLNLTPPGVTVVGIDNGVAAAAAAARMLKSANKINSLKQGDASLKAALQSAENLLNGKAVDGVNGHEQPADGDWGVLNGNGKSLPVRHANSVNGNGKSGMGDLTNGRHLLGLLFPAGMLLPKLVPAGVCASALLA
ncbi:hypothetical protein BSKO_04040 [Bryopsis sp. KO-2023]|nr:hypothetical protein BSKO_04040 [Bryopsis sp. KO-2023]